jgi:hypothetical protein
VQQVDALALASIGSAFNVAEAVDLTQVIVGKIQRLHDKILAAARDPPCVKSDRSRILARVAARGRYEVI